jgi:hypothetical protein
LLLDTVEVQSGARSSPTGGPTATDWDPYAHTFSPLDVAAIDHGNGTTGHYHVTQSSHRLTSTVWQTSHTLEKYIAASPLP